MSVSYGLLSLCTGATGRCPAVTPVTTYSKPYLIVEPRFRSTFEATFRIVIPVPPHGLVLNL
ncbi:hypothetical protein EA473_08790 [Natrarchaeobius chitinivorans]|uniref:Uncharacterized protein n=1 Tax=Natrarchaeobius chitinivorans TaxID=1679083 RepID=A0A3N6PE69_NATCH|nr:hypothetical protein EA473_08790 [Natrarchaeobius chitinivorans]